MTPLKVVAIFVAIGVAFIPTGVTLMNASDDVRFAVTSVLISVVTMPLLNAHRYSRNALCMTDPIKPLAVLSMNKTKEKLAR